MEFFASYQRNIKETAREMIAADQAEIMIPGKVKLRLLREDSPKLEDLLGKAGAVLSAFEVDGIKFYVCGS